MFLAKIVWVTHSICCIQSSDILFNFFPVYVKIPLANLDLRIHFLAVFSGCLCSRSLTISTCWMITLKWLSSFQYSSFFSLIEITRPLCTSGKLYLIFSLPHFWPWNPLYDENSFWEHDQLKMVQKLLSKLLTLLIYPFTLIYYWFQPCVKQFKEYFNLVFSNSWNEKIKKEPKPVLLVRLAIQNLVQSSHSPSIVMSGKIQGIQM